MLPATFDQLNPLTFPDDDLNQRQRWERYAVGALRLFRRLMRRAAPLPLDFHRLPQGQQVQARERYHARVAAGETLREIRMCARHPISIGVAGSRAMAHEEEAGRAS